jgi:hypothetical protein
MALQERDGQEIDMMALAEGRAASTSSQDEDRTAMQVGFRLLGKTYASASPHCCAFALT